MKVLVISNMYPKGNSNNGIFVKREIDSLERVNIKTIKIVKKGRNPLNYIPFILRSIFILFYKSYNLVHAHYGFHSALFAAIIKRRPLVVTFHRGDALYEPFRNKIYFILQRFVISRADHIIAVSNEIKNTLIKYLEAQPNNISVITCGIDTDLFSPFNKMKKRKELEISNNSKVVLFVGGFEYRKGTDILLKCAKRIPETNFVFIGKGILQSDCKNCRFIGPQPNCKLPGWFSTADVFVLPSRSEGTPVVLLEALSCEIPVVASRIGGIPDLVKDGETGYLVEPEDVDMFEKKLRELLENSEERRRMGQQGRKNMIANYDSQKVAKRIKQVYEKILSKNQRFMES